MGCSFCINSWCGRRSVHNRQGEGCLEHLELGPQKKPSDPIPSWYLHMTVSPLPGSGKVQAARGGTVQQFGVGRISDTDTDTDQQRWVYKTKEHADIHLGDTWRYCTMLLSMCTERGHCGDVMIHTQHRYVHYTYIRLYTYIYTMECDVLECSGISNVGRLMGQT